VSEKKSLFAGIYFREWAHFFTGFLVNWPKLQVKSEKAYFAGIYFSPKFANIREN